ncbi:MAG: hypothetical protein PHE50_02400 [Dehalococcoidales bacterium]|nr:hypothetical protein [Dehalococcoidales bacterium]
MNKIWIIAKKDILEAFRSRSVYVFIFVMIFLTFSFVTGYSKQVASLSGQPAIDDFSRAFLNGLSYTLPMMFSIFVCSIFANYSVIVDKAKRNIESLMASPVSINQIWMGKSLAVALPSVLIGFTVALLSYTIIDIGFVMPHTHFFVIPDIIAILSAALIVPVLIFAVVTIVTNIQLVISNPRIANLVFTIIFFVLFFGVNTLGALGISLKFTPFIYLGMIALCALISFILSRFLTREKVLLSSKI